MKTWIQNHVNYYDFRAEEGQRDCNLKVSELKNLLKPDNEIDSEIANLNPIEVFGNSDDVVRVANSDVVVNLHDKARDIKLDIVEKIANFEYVGVDNDKELILEVYSEEDDIEKMVLNCIYNSSYEFMELFSMGKYGSHCISAEQNDILRDNIVRQLQANSDVTRQFRLLQSNNKYYLRAITSTEYMNYNNNVALYLVLGYLHKLATKTNIDFYIKRGQISDSGIRLIIESDKEYDIDGKMKVKVGLLINNGELRDKSLSCSIRYRFLDIKDESLQFSVVTTPVEEPIFDIMHRVQPSTVIKKIKNLEKLYDLTDTMIKLIKKIDKSKNLSSDYIYIIYEGITKDRSGTFSKDTKESFKAMYDKYFVNNTYSLFKGFNMINSIVTNIEERLHLEKIYYQVIHNLAKDAD